MLHIDMQNIHGVALPLTNPPDPDAYYTVQVIFEMYNYNGTKTTRIEYYKIKGNEFVSMPVSVPDPGWGSCYVNIVGIGGCYHETA